VLFGGVKRIVKWTDKLSPLMCLLYIVACTVVLAANYANVPQALMLIVREAFAPSAVTGGVVGALIAGFRRAAFANEAGLGSAPMAHATVRTNEPMSQGFAALMEPFLDTVIICLATALVVVVTGVYTTSGAEGIALTSDAFATVVPWFPIVLAVVAILFALSTVLSWGYYGEQAWTWLFSERKASRVSYRLFLCAVLAVAPTLSIEQVTNIVDSLNFSMAIPNLIAVYLLMPELRADLADYWQRVVSRGKHGT
jgi:AGCS family alanine or glycine:cation symporter